MKKALFLILLAVPIIAIAQVVTPEAPPVPSTLMEKLKLLGMFLAANGGLTLLRAIVGYIPVVGPYLQKMFDVFMANPPHAVTP